MNIRQALKNAIKNCRRLESRNTFFFVYVLLAYWQCRILSRLERQPIQWGPPFTRFPLSWFQFTQSFAPLCGGIHISCVDDLSKPSPKIRIMQGPSIDCISLIFYGYLQPKLILKNLGYYLNDLTQNSATERQSGPLCQ